jgi:hypothetical protein
MYKAKVAACSEIHIKHSTLSEHHEEMFNIRTWWYVKKPLGFKAHLIGAMLIQAEIQTYIELYSHVMMHGVGQMAEM